MSNMFTLVNRDILIPGAPRLDPADFRSLIDPGPEADADGYWRFRIDDTSLTDVNNAEVLTPKNNDPTFDAVSMTTLDGGLHGLETPWNDQAVYSWVVTAKRPVIASNNHKVAGTIQSGGSTGGGVLWTTTGLVRVFGGFSGSLQQNDITPPTTLVAGDVCMIGWSQSASARLGVLSNGNGLSAVTRSNAMAHSVRKIALGNVETNIASWLYGMTVYEFMVWLGIGKTDAELLAVMRRSRLRLAYEGIVLK